MTSEKRVCQNCKKEFVVEDDDFTFYEKMQVPPPTWCPECRFIRRSVFRNEYNLYKDNCARCKNSVVTMFRPSPAHIVYCNSCWHSDNWDPKSYGRKYDPSRRFLDQLQELLRVVPKPATYVGVDQGPSINSDYTNFAGSLKDCYLVFNSSPNVENAAYSRGLANSKDIFDSYYIDGSESLYECVNAPKNSGVVWGQNISGCVDSSFLLDCSGCQNCFGCVNLRNKSYYFFNKPLSKEEWHTRVDAIAGSYREIDKVRNEFEKFSMSFPHRENQILKSVDCTGDYILDSKNCKDCFEVSFGENLKYSFATKYTKDGYDLIGHGRKGELLLENVGAGVGSRVLGSWWVDTSHDVEYSFMTRESEYCLGCVAMRGARYAILNEEYPEDEYRELRRQIVDELTREGIYGMYLPLSFAFFAYNEGIGQDYFPLTKEEALKRGLRWEDELQITKGKGTLPPAGIPDRIQDVSDGILNEVLTCVSCDRNYRLIGAELGFYRRMAVPVPRKCFYCRHADRLRRRGPMGVFDRTCDKCKKPIQTSYAPGRPEIVYCEECYQKEMN